MSKVVGKVRWYGLIAILLVISGTLFLVYKTDKFQPTQLREYPKMKYSTKTCTPKSNIFFMKTHKTASTTVQNILLRYADKNDLLVGLPKVKSFGYLNGKTFQKEFLLSSARKVNMLCHHLRLNITEVRAIMPNDTVFITILREPGSQFESIFDYFHQYCASFSDEPQNRTGLANWLKDPQKHVDNHPKTSIPWMAKNSVFYDMGYDNFVDDLNYINQSIKEISNIFDLVLISDYFMESVVLLRDILCWDLLDVVYLVTNARSKPETQINQNLREKIRSWNRADSALYDYFNRTFWKKVENYGTHKLERDIKKINKLNTDLRENCIKGDRIKNDDIENFENKLHNPDGVVMIGYNLKNESKYNNTCKAVIRPEQSWIEYLLYKSYQINSTRLKRDLKNIFYY